MGATSSKNNTDNIVKLMTDVHVSVQQSCSATVSQDLTVNFINSGSGTQNNRGDVNNTNTALVNASCTQSAQADAVVKNTVSTVIKQAATAVGQMVSASNVSASNNIKNLTDLSNKVSNAFKADCSALVAQSQTVNVTNSGTGVQNNYQAIHLTNTASATAACVQSAVSKTKVHNDISTMFSQIASAKTESLLGPLAALLVAIAIIIGVVLFGVARVAEKAMPNMTYLIPLVLVLGGLWCVVASAAEYWPCNKPDHASTATRAAVGGLGAGVLVLSTVIAVVFVKMSRAGAGSKAGPGNKAGPGSKAGAGKGKSRQAFLHAPSKKQWIEGVVLLVVLGGLAGGLYGFSQWTLDISNQPEFKKAKQTAKAPRETGSMLTPDQKQCTANATC
jgi:hypothetical protein